MLTVSSEGEVVQSTWAQSQTVLTIAGEEQQRHLEGRR